MRLGLVVSGRVLNRDLRSGDCLISIIPDSDTSASSLFRPRRFTSVFGGVFYWLLVELASQRTQRFSNILSTRYQQALNRMWQWDGSIATADLAAIQLVVASAVGDRRVQVKTREGLLLATLWDMPAVSAAPLEDVYVRDDDLVCLLGPTDSFPFHTQLYWTLRNIDSSPTPLAALSLLVAVRTDLLDTKPAIEVASELAASSSSDLSVAGGPAFLASLREGLTLVDFATPEDCTQQQLHSGKDQRTTIQRSLFGHFLEKGVIRSGRLFAALFDGPVTDPQAAAVCDELLATELPLTT